MNPLRRSSLFIASTLGALAIASPTWASSYVLTDLAALGAIEASGINDSGQVVGIALRADNSSYGFIYANGSMTDLGLPGNYTITRGINNAGQSVGYYGGYGGITSPQRAFLYSNGTAVDIGSLGGGDSLANDINEHGQVVGGSNSHAFLYSNGTMTNLGDLGGGESGATAINDAGVIVGQSFTKSGEYHAVIYSNGAIQDIGTLGGRLAAALDLNEKGQIVGYSNTLTDSANHAFLYDNGAMMDLGTLGGASSYASAINEKGEIVGYGQIFDENNPRYSDFHAFIYKGGSLLDLNTLIDPDLGWILDTATGINESGQIIAHGRRSDGYTGAVLLTPSAVPVPASAWLLGSGLLSLMGLARKSKAA